MQKWKDFKASLFFSPETELTVDWAGMELEAEYLQGMEPQITAALDGMEALERGSIANPDEERMVGHYWLRASSLAPTAEIAGMIDACVDKVEEFAAAVHSGAVLSQRGEKFRNLIVAGIGGSSLGPVFVSRALYTASDKMRLYSLDNTDPDGIDRVFAEVEAEMDETMMIVISKSGSTIETRNCMVEAQKVYERFGLDFARHAVCVTAEGSKLDETAKAEGWLARFPMWDWVGGRTSVTSAVGLLPLALQGVDIRALLKGAADCDALSRRREVAKNPALMTALCWYRCTGGMGGSTQVVLPYKDSLDLLTKYLQQLVMESLGKELDMDGNTVNQGLIVMGNKGTSDQHSYAQQLLCGPDNVFVTFVQVLKDHNGESAIVGAESTSGDYLNAFMLGVKKTLEEFGRRTMVVSIAEVTAYHIGQLIALYERVVGLYALFIGVNAYHQPAVEAGKRAANHMIEVKNALLREITQRGGRRTAYHLSAVVGEPAEDVFRLLVHMAANDKRIGMERKENYCDSVFFAAE